jgi:hypothetical protein
LREVVDLARTKSVSFMCTELGPTYCHRHRLALRLESNLGYVSYDL